MIIIQNGKKLKEVDFKSEVLSMADIFRDNIQSEGVHAKSEIIKHLVGKGIVLPIAKNIASRAIASFKMVKG